MSSTPSAQDFYRAECREKICYTHLDYMNFAERYADFVVEFEKKGGDLRRVERWPGNFIERKL
jgi:hypothetical protein